MDDLRISYSLLLLTIFVMGSVSQRSLTEVFSDCCGRGITFASIGQNCSGMAGLPDVALENKDACAAVFMSCCHKQKMNSLCEIGMLHGMEDGDCDALDDGTCSYSVGKECCNCCGLGMLAYHDGSQCNEMNINTPCDSAFSTCCLHTKTENDVTTESYYDPCFNSPCTHDCQESNGVYQCLCPSGYALEDNEITCNDVDECSFSIPPCAANENCVNSVGSYHCQFVQSCRAGLRYNAQTRLCADIDECSEGSHNCRSDDACRNQYGSFECFFYEQCRVGYTRHTVTNICIDVNECYQHSDLCPSGQRCENNDGSYRCIRNIACGTGYTVDSVTQGCNDVNECEQSLHRCRRNQMCINLDGSHMCEDCPVGYRVDHRNECTNDINECAERTHTCSSTQRCLNSIGTFTCSCILGYEYVEARRDCIDINECDTAPESRPCLEHQMCINLPGQYKCQTMCSYGSRYVSGYCQDIDECAEGTHRCGPMQECINQEGSHACRCPLGYRLVRSSRTSTGCEDIDECSERPSSCRGNCENTEGSYICHCPDGYTLGNNGFSCNDVNECTTNTHNCDTDDDCFNTLGTFKCITVQCPEYYEMRIAGDQRECIKNFNLCPTSNGPCASNRTVKYSFSAIALPSIPYLTNPIRLVTIDINKAAESQIFFRISSGNDRGYFSVRTLDSAAARGTQPGIVRASLMLIRRVVGPYSTDLHLELNTYSRGGLSHKTVIVMHVDIGANRW